MSKPRTPLQAKRAAQRASGIAGLVPSPRSPEYQQVTAFPLLSREREDLKLRKSPDLQEYAGRQPRDRDVLLDSAERLRKLCIETGTDPRTGRRRHAPLEPWTGPRGSVLMYANIMRDPDGTHNVSGYSGDGLAALEWMREERLISIGTAGEIHALSDAKAEQGRKYPGAPVPDQRAGIGKQLGDNMEGLVTSALFNLSGGRTVRPARRKAKRLGAACSADGTPITGAQVAEEVNAIKARRRDLDECRWASLSRVREVLRDVLRKLIGLGVIEQVSPPKPVRQWRSWRTLPRIIRRLQAATADDLKPDPLQEAT